MLDQPGSLGEWLKPTVLKTVVPKGTVSSNLTASANTNLAYRTLHVCGICGNDTEAIVTVDNQIVHQGSMTNGVLFRFKTCVTLHGRVVISITIVKGWLTVTHNRVVYPALINKVRGHVDMPQPIVQPNLPFTVTDQIIYDHYMFNGPFQWLIPSGNGTQVTISDFYQSVITGFMSPDWQYDHRRVDLNDLSHISLAIR
jgi:hypothetical protein